MGWKTALKRAGIVVLTTFVLVTGASLIFNVLSRPPETIDPGYGRYAQVGTARVHYEEWGSSGTPIVLVPGFLEPSVAFEKVGPLLAAHHRVYAVDLPGHGYTRYRGAMTLRGQAALVDGFVRALGLERPTLVGHSLGAAVVGEVALRDRATVGRVVFADGDGLPIAAGARWTRTAILDSPYATSAIRLGARWTWLDRHVITATCGSRCQTPSSGLANTWVRPLRQRSDERALRAMMAAGIFGLSSRQIGEIGVPTSIIWGSEDHQGGSLAATIRNLHHPPVHVIQRAGHLTMLADPHAFVQAVEAP